MKQNSTKIVAICALFVAVIALSIGFAAYSATLTIDSSATVEATNTFTPNVQYQVASKQCETTGTAVVNSDGQFNDGNHATEWSGISVTLKAPGDKVKCSATVENVSAFTAYLRTISTSAALSCASKVASGDGVATQFADTCAALKLNINAGGETATATSAAAASNTTITGKSMAATTGTMPVYFELDYPTGSAIADGDISVTVPTINFIYKTVDGS